MKRMEKETKKRYKGPLEFIRIFTLFPLFVDSGKL